MPRGPRTFPHETGADPLFLGFLDRLSTPLERTLTHAELAEVRLQALGHLEALIADLRQYEGLSASDSVARALCEYGHPESLAFGLLDVRGKGSDRLIFGARVGAAGLWSFVGFGSTAVVFTLVCGAAALWPGLGSWSGLLLPLSIALPIVAGALVGWVVPTGDLRGALPAMGILVAYAALVTRWLGPDEPALRPILDHALLMVPLGGAALRLTARARRRPIEGCARRGEMA